MSKLEQNEEELLKEDNLIWAMTETEGWKEVFEPWLRSKLTESFPDPTQFAQSPDPKESFLYAAMVSSMFKKVIAELLQFVYLKKEEAKALDEKKRSRKPDPFAIGA